MIKMYTFTSKEEWRQNRGLIGGSDAACILGVGYKSNHQLWMEKTGRAISKDLSDNLLVQYGNDAEDHLRQMFALDYPGIKVEYAPNNMFINDKYPWAHASLDGWLTDENGRRGVLEIKTASIMSSSQKQKWNGRIPENYYIQVLHYLMVTETDFAVVKAQLKYSSGDDLWLSTRHYFIERSDVADDIEYLAGEEKEFYRYIEQDLEPALLLPAI